MNFTSKTRKFFYFYIPVFAILYLISYLTVEYIYSTQQYIILKDHGIGWSSIIFISLAYLLVLLAFVKTTFNNEVMKPWIWTGSFFYIASLFLKYYQLISNELFLYTPQVVLLNISNYFALAAGSLCFTIVTNLLIQYLIKIKFIGTINDFLSDEKVLTAVVVAIITACFGLLGK